MDVTLRNWEVERCKKLDGCLVTAVALILALVLRPAGVCSSSSGSTIRLAFQLVQPQKGMSGSGRIEKGRVWWTSVLGTGPRGL